MTNSGRDLLLSHSRESAFQDWLMTTAARGGYHGLHIRQSHNTLEAVHSPRRAWPRGADHDDAWGFPDLLLIRPSTGELEFVEAKRLGERLRRTQELWHGWLGSVRSVRTHVWTPREEREAERVLLG